MKDYGLVMASVTELVVTIMILLFVGRYIDSHFVKLEASLWLSALLLDL